MKRNGKRTCELSGCFRKTRHSCTGCIYWASLHRFSLCASLSISPRHLALGSQTGSCVPACEFSYPLHRQTYTCTRCNKNFSPLCHCVPACELSYPLHWQMYNGTRCSKSFSQALCCGISCASSFSLLRCTSNCRGCICMFSHSPHCLIHWMKGYFVWTFCSRAFSCAL